MKKLLLLVIISCFIALASAQDNPEKEEKKAAKEEKKAAKQAKKAEKIAQGKFLISPLIVPGYTPELGGLIAVGALTSFKTNKKDDKIQRSSIPVTLGYTTTGAIVANAILTSFWIEDKMRIYGDFWYKDMPDNYWGIGYENAVSTPQSDSTTAYNREWWWINPRILFQVTQNYFVGINIDYNYTKGSEASEGVANDPNYITYNDRPLNSGLGLMLRYDSRDIPVDARKGLLVDLRGTFYTPSFGGDNTYQIYQLDYRQFQTLSREGMTLAWQIRTRIGAGGIPYGEMSQLGSPFDLRGYTWGRFRDKGMFYSILEYRHTFLKKDGELGKHGMVAWIASGTIFDVQESTTLANIGWLPNFGAGYRLELQPRMNLRLDFGIGRGTSGIYFNFNQAF
jgi:hypothetical protein